MKWNPWGADSWEKMRAVPLALGLAHRIFEEHQTPLLRNLWKACHLTWNEILRAHHGLTILTPGHLPDLSFCHSHSTLSEPVTLTSLLSSNMSAPPASTPLH